MMQFFCDSLKNIVENGENAGNVFIKLLSQGRENMGLFGKELHSESREISISCMNLYLN